MRTPPRMQQQRQKSKDEASFKNLSDKLWTTDLDDNSKVTTPRKRAFKVKVSQLGKNLKKKSNPVSRLQKKILLATPKWNLSGLSTKKFLQLCKDIDKYAVLP